MSRGAPGCPRSTPSMGTLRARVDQEVISVITNKSVAIYISKIFWFNQALFWPRASPWVPQGYIMGNLKVHWGDFCPRWNMCNNLYWWILWFGQVLIWPRGTPEVPRGYPMGQLRCLAVTMIWFLSSLAQIWQILQITSLDWISKY